MSTLNVLDNADRAAGLDLTIALSAASAGGDALPAGNDVYLRVKNGNAAVCTVTVMAAGANSGPNGTFLAPLALGSVPASTGDRVFGPFPASTFADPSDGLVHITYSVTTTVTVGVYRLTNA
jgi:hypothetical protein